MSQQAGLASGTTVPDLRASGATVPDLRASGAAWSPRRLFLISFTILFLELAAIRWLNASVTVLAYFNNFILISSFFGLGLGCLLAGRRVTLIRWYGAALLLLVLAVIFLQHQRIAVSYTEDVIFARDVEYYQTGLLSISLAALLGFFINFGFFVLLGQELGRQLKAAPEPLLAYAYDIGGSLLGVLAYAALAWFETPPHLWFALGGLALLLFLRRSKGWMLANAVLVLAATLLMAATYPGAFWSPYYKVEVSPYSDPENRNLGYKISVDNLRIQDALDFGPELLRSPLSPWVPYYLLPYQITQPEKVLILGAGAGNEVAVALMNGAREVHAVEIDPIIAGFGHGLHPETPYARPNVRIIVDDARSYISNTDERYDLIVMSALDSHRQIAGMTSLRLESFVYTVDAYRQVKELLADGGVFCLNLSSTRPWMGDRTYWSLAEAFGREPLVLQSYASPSGSVAYVLAEDLDTSSFEERRISVLPASPREADLRLSTDNWPYLYLEKNRVPSVCLAVLLVMMAASFAIMFKAEPAVRRPNAHFFFLGAGFMLLETRSITQMALLFGATWSVNAIVFTSILATIFITNLMVMKNVAPGRRASYGLLFAMLAVGYFFPMTRLLELDPLPRLAAALLVVGLPIAWASFIFSRSFRHEREISRVFGSNLLGVVFGGCLEYASNVFGLDALYLVALLLYLASFVYRPATPASVEQ